MNSDSFSLNSLRLFSGNITQLSIICLTWSRISVYSKTMLNFVFKIVVHINHRGYSLVFVLSNSVSAWGKEEERGAERGDAVSLVSTWSPNRGRHALSVDTTLQHTCFHGRISSIFR